MHDLLVHIRPKVVANENFLADLSDAEGISEDQLLADVQRDYGIGANELVEVF